MDPISINRSYDKVCLDIGHMYRIEQDSIHVYFLVITFRSDMYGEVVMETGLTGDTLDQLCYKVKNFVDSGFLGGRMVYAYGRIIDLAIDSEEAPTISEDSVEWAKYFGKKASKPEDLIMRFQEHTTIQ